jgi:ABC-2 type transport system ATP-binding protein
MSDRGPAIRISGLVKTYGSIRALDGLDLEVPQGVVYGFLGPNGAGKTTTMRILTGLIRSDAGQVELFGQPVRWLDREPMFHVGALIESPAFYPYLTGRENLRVLAGVGAPPRAGRVDEVLELVRLSDRAGDRYATYSLGMKQRLGIAAALLNDPPLLVLDEPANGLDPAGIVDMRTLLQTFAEAGGTVFVSSHILPEIQQMADQIAIIARGRLVRSGPLDRLLHESGHVRIRVGPDEVTRAVELLSHVTTDVQLDGLGPGWISVAAAPTRAAELNRALVAAGVDVSGLEVGSDLEALFLSLTKEV